MEERTESALELEEPGAPRRAGLARRLASQFLRRRWASILVVAVLLAFYFATANPSFLSRQNLLVIAAFTAATAIMAAGEVVLMICGEIDLSVGNMWILAPYLMYYVFENGLPIGVGIVAALVGSLIVGFVNGAVTVHLRVPSFVTTLGMLFLLNGVTLVTSGAFPIPTPGENTGFADVMGHSNYWELGWAVLVVVAMQVALSYTRWGLYTFATGGNIVGAREAGVNVNRIKIGAFMLCSFLGGFAGILEAYRVTSIEPGAGAPPPIMFNAISAAVIGGTALAGGSGTITGAFVGAIVLAILNDGFTLMGVNAYAFDGILGATILVAMILNVYIQRLRRQGET
jgi:simple sugar transport system permease protein